MINKTITAADWEYNARAWAAEAERELARGRRIDLTALRTTKKKGAQ